MSKGKKGGIIVGCIIVVIVVVVIVTRPSVLPPLGPDYSSVSGLYVLTEDSTTSQGFFEEWDIGDVYFDIENDGTLYLRYSEQGLSYVGQWTLNGNAIELQIEIWGSPIVWTGTVNGNTISLGDGSVWKK